MTDVVQEIAQHIVSARFEDLSPGTVEITKRSILDTAAVGVAGSGLMPEIKSLVSLVTESEGRPESSIWGFGRKAPAWMAAYCNGAMSHALDFDDVYDDCAVHPSATCVPAAFAVAERVGQVSGQELILAVAIANDLINRMSEAVSSHNGWFLTSTFGAFASAAACAKLLKLGHEQTIDALGIAFVQAAGTMEIAHGPDSNIRAMYECFVGKTGVLSSLMAQRGISGVKSSMEGKSGVFNIYFGGRYNRDMLTADLGKRFEGTSVSFKAWPFCRRAHPAVTAVISLMRREGIRPEAIDQIMVDTNAGSEALFHPRDARVRPKTVLDAKYSLPYTVAVAVRNHWVALDDFSAQALGDEATAALADRVHSRINPAYENIRGMTPGRVELKTHEGKVFTEEVGFPYGHPENPTTVADSVRKFRECAARAASPMHGDAVDRVLSMMNHLEDQPDVGAISSMLGGPVPAQ